MSEFIIGLSGFAGAGKDSVGKVLVEQNGFARYAFADNMKNACKVIFRFTDAQLYDAKEKEKEDPYWDISPRRILQLFGTEVMREGFDKNIWIKSLKRYVDAEEKPVVITDVRFKNEAAAIKKWGGFLVRVERPGNAGLKGEKAMHASETELANYAGFFLRMQNDGKLKELPNKVEAMLNHLPLAHTCL